MNESSIAPIASPPVPHVPPVPLVGSLWQKIIARRRDRRHPSTGYRRLNDLVRITAVSPARVKGVWQSDQAVCLTTRAAFAASFRPAEPNNVQAEVMESFTCPACSADIPPAYLARLRMALLRPTAHAHASQPPEALPCPACSALILDRSAVLLLGASIAARLSWSPNARRVRTLSPHRPGRPAHSTTCPVCSVFVPSSRSLWLHTYGGRSPARCKGPGDEAVQSATAKLLSAGARGTTSTAAQSGSALGRATGAVSTAQSHGLHRPGSQCLLWWDIEAGRVYPRHWPVWLRRYWTSRLSGTAVAVYSKKPAQPLG